MSSHTSAHALHRRPHPPLTSPLRTLALTSGAAALSRAWIAAVFGVPALVALAILLSPFPPLQDFPEWMYQGALVAQLMSGGPVEAVRFADYPVPNAPTQLALGLLSLAMPASAAALVFLLAYVVAATSVAWKLASRYRPEAAGPLCVVLLIAVYFNAPFWNGYTNYQLGLVLVGAWLALDEDRQTAPATLLAFGLLAFFTHLTAFICLVTLAGLEGLRARRIRPLLVGFAPSAALALWYAASMTRGRLAPGAPAVEAAQDEQIQGLVRFMAYKAYTFLKVGPYHNFIFASGGDAAVRPLAYWAGIGVNIAFGALLLVAVAAALWAVWRARSKPATPMLIAALLFILVFLALPPGRWVANTGERFLYPALMLLLVFLPLHKAMVSALAALALYFAVGLGGLASAASDWSAPVDPNWESPARVLFLHRPTTFLRKLEEVWRSEATGDVPRLPLAFETSVLIEVSRPAR